MDANKLKYEILKSGLSQSKLANMLRVDQKTLSNKVTGKTDFKLSEVIKICEILQIENPRDVFW